jgi:hypothetical protein
MSTRSSIFALAAAAGLAAAVFAPTGATAKPVLGIIIQPHPPIIGVPVKPPHPILGVVVHPPHPILGIVVHPGPDPDPPHIWWHHHHAPWLIEEGVAAHVSTPVAPAPTGPCNCLTKKYLEDGSVLFKDICTKEAALATPDELKAQVQGAGP